MLLFIWNWPLISLWKHEYIFTLMSEHTWRVSGRHHFKRFSVNITMLTMLTTNKVIVRVLSWLYWLDWWGENEECVIKKNWPKKKKKTHQVEEERNQERILSRCLGSFESLERKWKLKWIKGRGRTRTHIHANVYTHTHTTKHTHFPFSSNRLRK